MLENINLKETPKESGIYRFLDENQNVIYIGSSKNLYDRMANHRSSINKGSNQGHQTDLYQFLKSNQFTVEYQTTEDYKQIEQELIEQYNPKYNSNRANTGLGAKKGRETEWKKAYDKKYEEEIRQNRKQYKHQLCSYNGEILTLNALSKRFRKRGIEHSYIEAKQYLIDKKFIICRIN